jgi:ABC-type multidrug transport system fused ATPase/permease subunit
VLYILLKWTAILSFGSLWSYFRRLSAEKVEIFVSNTLKAEFFTELLQKKLEIITTENSGSISHMIARDIPNIASILTTELSAMLKGVCYFIGGLVLVLYTSPNLALFTFFPLSLLIVVARHYGSLIRKQRSELARLERQLSSYTLEKFKQIRSVKLFSAEFQETQNFSSLLEQIAEKKMQVIENSSRFYAILEAIGENMVLIGAGILLYLLRQESNIKRENLITFVSYIVFCGSGFKSILSGYTELKKYSGLYKKINSLMGNSNTEEVLLTPAAYTKGQQGININIDSIFFTYPNREIPAIQGISLEINNGEIIGLIGESGNGKSTITHLITNLYTPQSGKIFINGVDMCSKPSWWSRQFTSIVSQEGLLFYGTILENIKYSKLDSSLAEVENVCKRADALDFIKKLPHGFDTKVGEDGILLSGGQRQRILIARALLKQPDLLILDEATSGLDQYSESVVQNVIEQEVKKKEYTVLIVTHRVSSLKNLADRIFCIQGGKIISSGTYEQLSSEPEFQLLTMIK